MPVPNPYEALLREDDPMLWRIRAEVMRSGFFRALRKFRFRLAYWHWRAWRTARRATLYLEQMNGCNRQLIQDPCEQPGSL